MNNKEGHIVDYSLIAKHLDNSASKAESDFILNWINLSGDNRKEFERLKLIWKRSAASKYDAEPAWQKMKSRMDSQKKATIAENGTTKGKLINMSMIYKIAASVIVILSVYTVSTRYYTENVEIIEIAASSKILSDTLPDNSVITLNKNSNLVFAQDFSKKERRVKLKGEAFFKIKRNIKKPFIVDVNNCEVKVLGTSFNVKDRDSIIEVSVKSGKVKIYKKNNKNAYIILVAGEKGSIDNRTGDISKTDINVLSNISWINRILVFEDTNLETVFHTIEKIYDIKIDIKDASIYELPYTTTFEDMELLNILDIISATFDLEYTQNQNTIKINRRK